jgi:TATA-binding protein-associated factor
MEEVFKPILTHYVESTSMLQKVLAAIVSEQWAREYDAMASPDTRPLLAKSPMAQGISKNTLTWLQGDPPPAYHEMAFTLSRIHVDCYNLLHSFAQNCKLPISTIPYLHAEIDVTGAKKNCFTIETAQESVGPSFMKLKESLGRTKKKEVAAIEDKRLKVIVGIERYLEIKAQHDTRVSAAFAAAFVAFKSTPDKVSPVVKGIMNGIKVSFFLHHLIHVTD